MISYLLFTDLMSFDDGKGCVFLISTWYTRFETQKRLAIFYLGSMVISGFSKLMGLGITKLNGVGGVAGKHFDRYSQDLKDNQLITSVSIVFQRMALDFHRLWSCHHASRIRCLFSHQCAVVSSFNP